MNLNRPVRHCTMYSDHASISHDGHSAISKHFEKSIKRESMIICSQCIIKSNNMGGLLPNPLTRVLVPSLSNLGGCFVKRYLRVLRWIHEWTWAIHYERNFCCAYEKLVGFASKLRRRIVIVKILRVSLINPPLRASKQAEEVITPHVPMKWKCLSFFSSLWIIKIHDNKNSRESCVFDFVEWLWGRGKEMKWIEDEIGLLL